MRAECAQITDVAEKLLLVFVDGRRLREGFRRDLMRLFNGIRGRFMMGRQAVSESLFYDFRLEDHVPEKHLLRSLDNVLRFDGIRVALASYYSHTGRPSIDPELMLRMMLVGYAYGIRSERRLCEEVHLNLAYRWFCRLGLEGKVPDSSTFSKNRYGRFQESGIYRAFFEEVVRQCQQAGLVGGDGFAVDGTVIVADVNYDRRVSSAEELKQVIDPAHVSRPVQAYLDALNAAMPEEDKKAAAPARISITDPQAAWHQKQRLAGFGYYSNYLIDTKHAVIVDMEATPARPSQEVVAARTMLERAEKQHGMKPRTLAADKLYGSGHFLSWLFDRHVEPHIPIIDRTGQVKGILTRDDFTYDAATDTFTCPEGKTLSCFSVSSDRRHYRASIHDCKGCPRKTQCTQGSTDVRRLSRHRDEEVRDYVKALQHTEGFKASGKARKKVEMLFAHLKQQFRFRRLKLRGLSGAKEECLLAATVQNLRRLIRLRPPDKLKTCPPSAA
jgi:transposase